VVLAWCDGTHVAFAVFTSDLQGVTYTTAAGVGAACNLTGAALPSSVPHVRLFWTEAALPTASASPSDYRTRVVSIDGANYTVTVSSVLLRSVGLAGKAFAMDGIVYVPLAYESIQQPTNFLADEKGNIVAKMLPGVAIGQLWGRTNGTNNTLLPETSVLGRTVHLAMQERFANQGQKVLGAIGTGSAVITLTTSVGVTAMSLRFGDRLARAALANTMHFGGGLLFMYDGATVVEHGFHLYPEGLSAASPGGDHQYQYVVCYEWMDLQGNLHRSAPSPAVTVKRAAPIGPTEGVTLTIPTLRLTAKQTASSAASRRPVTCTVYRTEDLGSVFHRAKQKITETANDTTIDTIQFSDTATDDELRAQPQLYTTGGVLENIAPSAPAYLAMIENRLWIIDSSNPLKLWFSKECVPGSPVEFSDFLVFNLEPRTDAGRAAGGGAVALARLDDKTVVLREDGLSCIIGQGPDSLGNQNDLREVQLPAEMGCSEPASVLTAGDGVLFKSAKGFFKLARDLSTQYIGADVEAWNHQHVTSATLLPHSNFALFTLSGGAALMYDYLVGQWSVFPGLHASDGCVFQGLHTFIDPHGTVHQETRGAFSDGGQYIPIQMKTAWIQLAGLQGFKRVWQFLLLGDWFSPHKLKVELAYDFDGSTVQQTDTIDSPEALKVLQHRIQCAVQQCQAIQITLTELPPDDGTVGEGLALSALSFELGLKPGSFRLPASQSKG
jgi:hypothetical protein